MKYYFYTIVFILSSIATAFANDVINTHTQNTISQNTLITSTSISSAKEWDLTEIEWIRYQNLMRGYSGQYYQKLSPPEVLGINAETEEEMRHFAEISAKQEHEKLERELKFNAAFHQAASRLFSGEQIIKSFDLAPFTPISHNTK